MDQRFEVRLETLREVIEAMGGELLVTARFPDAEYPIGPFNPIRYPDPPDEDFIARPLY